MLWSIIPIAVALVCIAIGICLYVDATRRADEHDRSWTPQRVQRMPTHSDYMFEVWRYNEPEAKKPEVTATKYRTGFVILDKYDHSILYSSYELNETEMRHMYSEQLKDGKLLATVEVRIL